MYRMHIDSGDSSEDEISSDGGDSSEDESTFNSLLIDGLLFFLEDPILWIRRNPTLLLSVRRLKLDYSGRDGEGIIGDSIGVFTELTHLSIYDVKTITCLPNILTTLPNLQMLELHDCDNLQELPPNLGDLKSLVSLSISYCYSLKAFPDSLTELSNLTELQIIHCHNLKKLPANFGELQSLTQLRIEPCSLLEECLSNLKVVDLSLNGCCSTQSLRTGLSKLTHLILPLSITDEENLATLKYLVNLRYLKFWHCLEHEPIELPANLDNLPKLSVLDIKDTGVKCLPSSIMKLSTLRLLILPSCFILETLPYQLGESLVISVEDTHVRKTWGELKKEMEIFSFPTVREMILDPSEYLLLTGDHRPWIRNNKTLHSKVRILDLELGLPYAESILNSVAELRELTHLYITEGFRTRLLMQVAGITHLSLYDCDFKFDMVSSLDSLGKLPTLESLHISMCDTEVLNQMDLPVSLRQLTLCLGKHPAPLPDSMTKLSNLKALHLFGEGIQFDSLPEILNLKKLKLVDCYIKSLPRGLQHVEILHGKGTMCLHDCDKLGNCFNQLINVETLSVTCHHIKSLPSIAGLRNLQELQLKDCFRIKELPKNLDVMVNLCTLNVSGTRIKSLPRSISELPLLQKLILPKCFQSGISPLKFRSQSIRVYIDDTDDKYYKYKDSEYYNFVHETCSEVDNNTTNSIERVNEVVSQQQISTSVLGDSHGGEANHPLGENSDHTFSQAPFPSSQHIPSMTPEFEHGFLPNFFHDFSWDAWNNIPASDCGQNEDNMNWEDIFLDIYFSEEYREESEEGVVEEQQTSLQQSLNLLDAPPDFNSNSRNDLVGKSSHPAISRSQNQEIETLPSEIRDEMITESSSNFQETGRNSLHAVKNGQMHVINSETEHEISLLNQEISSCNKRDVSCSGDKLDTLENQEIDKKSQNEGEKSKKHRREITRKDIQILIDEQKKLVDAAKELSVSRSTLKRKLREFNIKWPSSRIANRKKHNTSTKLPSNSNSSSQVNLVPDGHEYAIEGLDGADQHILPDQEPNQNCNVIDNSTIDAIVETVEVPLGETLLHTDDHGLNPSSLSDTMQKSGSSCSFVVKATYKEDTVKFKSFSTTIVEIKKEVADNLELELGKFKIKYEDSDKELLLMTKNKHLEDARNLSDSSGSNFLRLFIFDL